LHGDALNQLATAGAEAQKAEQDKRLALEQKLAASEQTHYRKLSDAQRDQDRLRDRLATADLRLSVLIDADSASGCDVPKAPAPAAWIMQPYEPDLTRRMLNELSPSPTPVTVD
jgi:hypothetical protein